MMASHIVGVHKSASSRIDLNQSRAGEEYLKHCVFFDKILRLSLPV